LTHVISWCPAFDFTCNLHRYTVGRNSKGLVSAVEFVPRAGRLGLVGAVRLKPFYLSSETVLPIK
jgi:hypothetical protein